MMGVPIRIAGDEVRGHPSLSGNCDCLLERAVMESFFIEAMVPADNCGL